MARRLTLTVFMMLLAVLLAARAAPAQHGGVLRIAEREAPGLDPHLSISFLTHSYVSLVYSLNGRAVRAEAVEYSLDRFMAKSGFRERFEPIKFIDVLDRYAVRFTLKGPYAPFLDHLANLTFCAILPHEA
jgi:hypothetical protein